MKARLTLLALLAAFASVACESDIPATDSIRAADLRTDLFFLASDAMGGRLTNTNENLVASEWVKARFERLGISPAVPGYFQTYNLVTATLGPTNALEIVIDGTPTAVPHGEGYAAQSFSATAEARAPVAFAGYGMSAPDLGHDDYRAADEVRGAIVLVLNHEPGERDPDSPFDGVVTSDASGALRKAHAAQAAGAAGILFVSDVHNHPGGGGTVSARTWTGPPSRLGRYTLEAWTASLTIPAAQISADLASRLVAGTGRTLEELAQSADTSGGVDALRLPGVEVRLAASVDWHPVPDRNVLAMVEGADPALQGEVVVISAHFDHNGADGDQIYNGADDDGSGMVGLLEIAEAYAEAARAGRRPRRSVLFAAFNSEERGLIGAWVYTTQPVVPLDKTVAVLNLDMIGRNEEVPEPAPGGGRGRFNGLDPQTAASNANALNIIGSVRSPDLRAEVERANSDTGLEIRYRYDNSTSQLMRRSDHWPFIQNGVPGIWVFTGLHPDYHTPDDLPDRINYEKMERITRLVYQMSWALAEADGRPVLLPRAR